MNYFLLICILARVATCDVLKFPDNFRLGVSTSAYQVEGAWNASDKSESIWDHSLHENPDIVTDRSNGDVACDSYNLYKRDVQMIKELGAQMYRFSISWTRLLPNGDDSVISEAGAAYYNNLINELLANDIEPVVTIFHFDLPQSLQDYGGWNNASISDHFLVYSNVVFQLFGDRVKLWNTINEPAMTCYMLTSSQTKLPLDVDPYACLKNIMLSHAKAYWNYHYDFKPKYGGKVSIANHYVWYLENDKDSELAEFARDYGIGLFTDPIYSKDGGWPENIAKIIKKNPLDNTNGLQTFTDEERDLIKGTYDYMAFNHYTSVIVRRAEEGETIGPWPFSGGYEIGAIFEPDPEWETSSFINIYPKGIRDLMNWMYDRYELYDLEYLITESGYSAQSTGLEDDAKIRYLSGYLTETLKGIEEDGLNVIGFTAWSLMDNFEWTSGYTEKFGLYEVNFTDPMRPRTPRKSAQFYGNIARSRTIEY